MIAVTFLGAGGPEVMSVGERPDPVPLPSEVLVRATHAGLNPADLIQRAGSYPAPPDRRPTSPASRWPAP